MNRAGESALSDEGESVIARPFRTWLFYAVTFITISLGASLAFGINAIVNDGPVLAFVVPSLVFGGLAIFCTIGCFRTLEWIVEGRLLQQKSELLADCRDRLLGRAS